MLPCVCSVKVLFVCSLGFVSASLYVEVSLATFVGDFFCLAQLAFCLRSRNFYTDFGIVLVRDTNILSARVRLLSTLR